MWGLNSCSFRGDSAFMIPPFCLWVATLGIWVLTWLHLCSSYPSWLFSFFIMSLVVEELFCQCVFSENCSTCRCLFYVFVGSRGPEVHSASSYSIILITSCQARDLVVAMKKSNTILEWMWNKKWLWWCPVRFQGLRSCNAQQVCTSH